MEFSLPAWLGALCGMIVAAAIYGPGIRMIERRLRIASPLTTAAERSAFEDRLSLMRRLILAFDVGVLAVLGYWIGDIIGGKMPGATGG
jgi:hypothetical protein